MFRISYQIISQEKLKRYIIIILKFITYVFAEKENIIPKKVDDANFGRLAKR